MNLLIELLIVLTIGAGSQDTTQVKINCPQKTNRDYKKCIIKQDQINMMAEKVNIKLDSINAKLDRRMEQILKLLNDKD